MTKETKLVPGDNAPDFSVTTSTGSTFTLSRELSESTSGVIVYFYPRASTPGCTTQACDFRDNLARLSALGYSVIGVSPDTVTSLQKFVDKQKLDFILGSDPEKNVATAYGAWGEKKNYGRVFLGIRRSTFVINKEGVIVHALYNVRAKGHVDRVVKLLEN
ncbi:MAG: thioredoxin-dependent thiol peroxidase [Actinomycetaceae bacterium]|nr:thioredoxin-dependent thiol peroxidase [Actinomycetaceae bacterium]